MARDLGAAPGDQGTGKRRAAVDALATARARGRRVSPPKVSRRFAEKRRKSGYRGRA